MIRTILKYPNPKLKEKSVAVEFYHLGFDLDAFARDLVQTMEANRGIGIAAIQVGVPKRLIIVKQASDSSPLVMVNPVITDFRGDKLLMTEGCLSFPGIFEKVKRFEGVNVTYERLSGVKIHDTLYGRDAHVIQHEVEHLDGMLLSDHVTRAERGRIMGEMKKLSRIR
jgi:peptide deformylase